MDLILILLGLLLLIVLPLPVLYVWKSRKVAGSCRILLAALAIQILVMAWLWYAVLADLGPGAEYVLLGYLLGYAVAGFLVGLLLCPLCYREYEWLRPRGQEPEEKRGVEVLELTLGQ